jgi:glycosyltransferase involved in cell wall biosynthesis
MDPGTANSLVEPRRKISVIIPCFNEAHSNAEVVHGFKSVLPSARVYVFDNNSTDETVAIASAAGARIRREALQGKGNVVRRMFADVDADAYVMADGDATYDPSYAAQMDNRLFEGPLDMVVGTRVALHVAAYRLGHQFGNRLLTFAVANLAIALALGIPLIITFMKTGLVPRQPTAILATGLVLLSALSLIAGMILDTVTRGRLEMRRLAYLAVPQPDS